MIRSTYKVNLFRTMFRGILENINKQEHIKRLNTVGNIASLMHALGNDLEACDMYESLIGGF